MVRSGKEEMESGSGSDQVEGGLSANEQDIDLQQPPNKKKKRYHRHTSHQIQEMEAYASIYQSIYLYIPSFKFVTMLLCYTTLYRQTNKA